MGCYCKTRCNDLGMIFYIFPNYCTIVVCYWLANSVAENPPTHLFVGSFPMTEYEDENVLAMTTDLEESHLITGDTAGIISVFHIQHYCNPMAVYTCAYLGQV